MFDMVDTVFSYGRALIVCYYLQESSKAKKVICMKSEMQILRFYLVRQKCLVVLTRYILPEAYNQMQTSDL